MGGAVSSALQCSIYVISTTAKFPFAEAPVALLGRVRKFNTGFSDLCQY